MLFKALSEHQRRRLFRRNGDRQPGIWSQRRFLQLDKPKAVHHLRSKKLLSRPPKRRSPRVLADACYTSPCASSLQSPLERDARVPTSPAEGNHHFESRFHSWLSDTNLKYPDKKMSLGYFRRLREEIYRQGFDPQREPLVAPIELEWPFAQMLRQDQQPSPVCPIGAAQKAMLTPPCASTAGWQTPLMLTPLVEDGATDRCSCQSCQEEKRAFETPETREKDAMSVPLAEGWQVTTTEAVELMEPPPRT